MSTPDVVDTVDLEKMPPENLKKLLEELYQYEKEVCDACERVREQIEKIKSLIGK